MYIEKASHSLLNAATNEASGFSTIVYEEAIERVRNASCAKFDLSLEALASSARMLLVRSVLFSPYLSPQLAPWVKRTSKKLDRKRLEEDIAAWRSAKSAVASATAAETSQTPYERRMSTMRKLTEAVCLRSHIAQLIKRTPRSDSKGQSKLKYIFTLEKLAEHASKSDHALEIVCMALFAPAYLSASSLLHFLWRMAQLIWDGRITRAKILSRIWNAGRELRVSVRRR